MQNQNEILEEKIRERTAELETINVELMVAKDKAEASDRLKTAFINNISHEIRTPLNGILGFGEMLVNYDLQQEEKEEFLAVLKMSSDRLLGTVTDYMDIAFLVSGNVAWNETVFPATNLLEEIYRKFAPACQKKKLAFIANTPPAADQIAIKTDYVLLQKVLSHLVGNAIKFTWQGTVSVGFEMKENEIEFFVKDTGIGIGEESQSIIFEQFGQENSSNTRGYEGSGLGLTIAKKIVELCGGRIWLNSVKDEGSEFRFTIPYASAGEEKPVQEKYRKEEAKVSDRKKLKILIAEDVEASEQYLTLALRRITRESYYATTGISAVEACRIHPDLDLILMDIRMPELSGYDATIMIRQFNKDVIIIAQTAYAELGDKEKAIQSGCNDFIAKPINQALLMELIHKHIPNISED
jgi:CheY-like chemotaxis protein/nitrogen-specific signal transduction histidine kinase